MFLVQHRNQCPGWRRLQMTGMAQAAPTRKPVTTCESECWRSIMRAVPTAPASISTKAEPPQRVEREGDGIGLPVRLPRLPMAAVWGADLPPYTDEGTYHLDGECHYPR